MGKMVEADGVMGANVEEKSSENVQRLTNMQLFEILGKRKFWFHH